MNRRGFFGLLLGIFAGTFLSKKKDLYFNFPPEQKEFFINYKQRTYYLNDLSFCNYPAKSIITGIDIPEGY